MSLQTQDVVAAVKKHPLRTASILLIVALGATLYFRHGGLQQLEQQLEQRTQEGSKQQANITNGALLGEHLTAVREANEAIAARAINPRALADNLQYFYQLEASVGVRLIDLRQGSPAAAKADHAYVGVPYTVAVDGTYPQLLQFLQRLERGSLFVKFTQLTISPQRDAGRADGVSSEPLLTLSTNLEILGRP